MNYIAVRVTGDPNQENGEYKWTIGLLYSIVFTIKMSKKGDHRIEGYFYYVVLHLGDSGGRMGWREVPISTRINLVEFL